MKNLIWDVSHGDMQDTLPKYRDMIHRLAQDPVGQVIQFELLMRLFFQHVLKVRPETLDCRRNAARGQCREWCSDGTAMASTGAGMIGPVLAFRGELKLKAEALCILMFWCGSFAGIWKF